MQKLKISGMSCFHCEKAVHNILEDMGASNIRVSAKEGIAEFEAVAPLEKIVSEIREAGYEVITQ